MGNTQTNNQNPSQLLSNYTQIRKHNNDTILSDKSGDNQYLLKQFNFADKFQYQKQLNKYQKLQKQGMNENLLSIVRFTGQEFNNFCSNSYKIYVLYEYPPITLEDEIQARSKENKFFEECELWSIIQSCTNALGQINPAIAMNPRNIFIVPDGSIKVINNDMISQDHRCVINDSVYYAPEKIKNFHKIDNENSVRKQSIFSLGMTILHAALLNPLHDCYTYSQYSFNDDRLQEYFNKLINSKNDENGEQQQNISKYSDQLIQILDMIVQPNPNKRASLMQVHGMLNKVWNTSNEQDAEEDDQQNKQSDEIPQEKTQQKSQNRVHQDSIKKIYEKNQIHQENSQKKPSYHQPLTNFPQNPIKPYLNYYPNTTSHYTNISLPQPPITSSLNKQNIYTNPQLLQMIRKDLHDLNQLKRSCVVGNSSYYPSSYTSYNNYTSFTKTPLNMTSNNQQLYFTTGLTHNNGNMFGNQGNTFQKDSQANHKNNAKDNNKGEYVCEEFEDGRKFQGYVKNGMKQGYGKMIYTDGAYYEGNFKEDKMHGKGSLFYEPNKPAYEGQWICDQFHGKGILHNESPQIFTESFNYNDFNQIEEWWIRYQGYFQADNKCGEGRLILCNGEQFIGHFENDCINGQGKFRTKQGTQIHGFWKDNMLVQMDF